MRVRQCWSVMWVDWVDRETLVWRLVLHYEECNRKITMKLSIHFVTDALFLHFMCIGGVKMCAHSDWQIYTEF